MGMKSSPGMLETRDGISRQASSASWSQHTKSATYLHETPVGLPVQSARTETRQSRWGTGSPRRQSSQNSVDPPEHPSSQLDFQAIREVNRIVEVNAHDPTVGRGEEDVRRQECNVAEFGANSGPQRCTHALFDDKCC